MTLLPSNQLPFLVTVLLHLRPHERSVVDANDLAAPGSIMEAHASRR